MTTFDPLGSDKPLILYIDVKSPYAFIAKDPTWALADELGIEIDWRPLTLDIPSYLGSAKLDQRGKVAQSNRTAQQWGGVRYAYMDARRYAAAYGYELRGTEKIWNTRLIHIAFMWVKQHGQAPLRKFINAVYPPFWIRRLDVEDEQVVLRCIEEAGVASDGFLEWAAAAGGVAHDEQQAAIFAAGIYGVPGYVYAGEYFFGREHLPRLRNLILAQKHGASPALTDIANSLPGVPEVLDHASDKQPKAAVFADMRQSAKEGRLQIVAGTNPACTESRLAHITLEQLQRLHPHRLRVDWAELPPRKVARAEHVEATATRGDRHRAARADYELAEQARAEELLTARSNEAATSGTTVAVDMPSENAVLTRQLQENGVKNSFGFVYVDANGSVHPFNGRQHLCVLFWALS